MPKEFVWPSRDLARSTHEEELNEPVIDLGGFMRGDESAIAAAARLVKEACVKHGFFQVTNHGVDPSLVRAAHDGFGSIFELPMSKKLSAIRQPGGVSGYSGAHADRYTSKLPWKETFSFHHRHRSNSSREIVDFFTSVLGQDFEDTG
ncbi:Gibberellin 20 oxidase 2 [Senna tora]|uniref:Gibberellin 20 oxidase 2 n=1 Tax=Senna tora TaxID=362788 RepID=A0A835C9D3_9FABA|nr:Gibberellin 20 oxidase 2 [Senna tora]